VLLCINVVLSTAQLPPSEFASDAQIQRYLLANVKHPSQLRPFLLHTQSSVNLNDGGMIGQAVKKRAQVSSTVLPHTVIVAQDVPGKMVPAPISKQGPQTKVHQQISLSTTNLQPLPVLSQSKKPNGNLPDAITMSIEYLLRSGFDVEGVFDTPPKENSPKIQTYLRSFHEGLGQFIVFGHVSEAAGCLLAHLATVPEPLLSCELHLCFLSINDEMISEEDKIGRCRNLLHTLPSNALALIKYVTDFCAVLVSRCKDRQRGLVCDGIMLHVPYSYQAG
jgi:hypothetical protein